MKIIFMGTPPFAEKILDALVRSGNEIAAVVTAPDKPRGRGQQFSFTAVKTYAHDHSLPVLQPEKLSDPAFVGMLRSFAADLFIVVAFRILPRVVYTLPPYGTFNLHASLLPKYRGAAPINWAIMKGETESGITTFFLNDKVDTGSVIMQEKIPITPEMTAGELHDRLAETGAGLVLQSVALIKNGSLRLSPQDEALASPAPKIFHSDCRILWDQQAVCIHNFIRGLSPYPCAWTMHRSKIIKIVRSAVHSAHAAHKTTVPGMVRTEKDTLFISCRDGEIEILEIQTEGKKKMRADEFIRGYHFGTNEIFGKDQP